MLACTRSYAGFDVAIISLRICAVVGEQARCQLVPGPRRQLGRVRGTRGTV